MSCGRVVEGAGCVTWWGFGPSQDLLNSGTHRAGSEGELNVLVVGSGDPRHILKTIAGLSLSDKLHVWVIENNMEVVARQLLLLYLSLETPERMSLHKKVEVFLEVFGNSEIRKETEEVLKQAAAQLSLSISNSLSSDFHSHQCLNTSLLRFKERDELVRIFRQWEHPPPMPASVSKVWDARVRKHLGPRYDSRRGAFDWDLTMKLHERGCITINKHQYAKWRESGVAFEMREGLYQSANQSLLSARVFNHKGEWVAARGYWGDIVSSPYLSFGIETENKELLRKQNNQHMKTAQDLSEANILALFESLASRGHHTLKEAEQNTTQETESLPKEESKRNASQTLNEPEKHHTGQQMQELVTGLMRVRGVRVSFLSPDSLSKLPLKNQYRTLFNSIFCSASMFHQLNSSLREVAAPEAVLVIELANFLLDLSNDQVSGFAERVKKIAEESGFTSTEKQQSPIYSVFTLKQD